MPGYKVLPIVFLMFFLSFNLFANKINAKYTLPDKIIFVGGDQPPYEYYDNNALSGFHIDLIDEIMKRLGKEYEINLMQWAEARKKIDNGEADVLMGMMYTEERTKKYSFGLAHSFTTKSFVTKRRMYNTSMNDLTGKRVIVQSGGKMEEEIRGSGINCQIIPSQTLEEGLNMLIREIGDIMVCNNIIANHYNNKLKLGLYINNIENDLPEKYCMAVKKGNENLLLSLNSILQQLKADGTYNDLYEKWFGVYEKRHISTWLRYIAYSLIIISLTILCFSIYLRRKVKNATKKIENQNNQIKTQNEQIKEQNDQIKEQNKHIKQINMELTSLNEVLSMVLKSSDSGYVFLSPEMDIIWENVSSCKKLNYPNIYYQYGNKCYDEVITKSNCIKCPVKRSLITKEIEKSISVSPTGIPIELTSTPIINDNVLIGFVLRIDDITEREKKFKDLANEKEDLVKSEILKSAFISRLGHDIQLPINSIINFASQIDANSDFITDEKYKTLIKTNSVLLQKLVSEVLNMSNIESGQIYKHKVHFDINQLFYEIENTFKDKIEELIDINFSLELEKSGCIINTDKNRLKHIIINFISNSIKFTNEGSIIAGYFIEDKNIKIYVEDTGCGIDKENIEQLFEKLPDIENITMIDGFGLSVCKSIADVLGAEIGVESQPGKGSIFWISLPIDVEEKIKI